MRAIFLLMTGLLALFAPLSAGASMHEAAAMPIAGAAKLAAATVENGRQQNIRYDCRCESNWGPREYWRWDHRPIWDDPWHVLKPNFWGSPEPHLVPAEIWVRKWRLRWPWRYRHWHAQ
jgi:hypothetical protein